MDNVGGYWDALYSNGAHADASYDGWLDTFRDVLARAGRVLELGAGDGAGHRLSAKRVRVRALL